MERVKPVSSLRQYLRIKGRVQGIGYRYFVVQTAKKLALTGWVKNCSNGDVECEVQGEEKNLSAFVHSLKTGHPWARVDQLQQEKISEKEGEQGFEIRF